MSSIYPPLRLIFKKFLKMFTWPLSPPLKTSFSTLSSSQLPRRPLISFKFKQGTDKSKVAIHEIISVLVFSRSGGGRRDLWRSERRRRWRREREESSLSLMESSFWRDRHFYY